MPNFTAGTSFTDGVTNDVTAAKLNALVADAVPTSNLALTSTSGTIGLFSSGTGTAATPAIQPTSDTNTGLFFPAADTIAFSEGGAESMRIDSSGNVGIGTVSPINKLHLYNGTNSVGATQLELEGRFNGYGAGINFSSRTSDGGTLVAMAKITADGEASWNTTGTTQDAGLRFSTTENGTLTERLRIDSSGNVLVGQSSGSYNIISKSLTSDSGDVILSVERQQTSVSSLLSYAISQTSYNAANSANKMGRDGTTLRSLNAGGTVNSSGADYAEYMFKSGNFTVAKGDIVGINAQGQLTNVFSDAVSFCVKSTDPSYVGGDVWGNEDAIGKRPELDAPQAEKDAFEATLETARQAVDRIAFAGQVPVNVLGATAGQYVIPVNDGGAIKGELVSSPTFEQYKSAIGKVIAIEQDGRARIIVKVA